MSASFLSSVQFGQEAQHNITSNISIGSTLRHIATVKLSLSNMSRRAWELVTFVALCVFLQCVSITCAARPFDAPLMRLPEKGGVDESRLQVMPSGSNTFMDCGTAPVCGVLTLETGWGGGLYGHDTPTVHGLWPQVPPYGNSACLLPK